MDLRVGACNRQNVFVEREREREREKERGVPVMDFTPLYTREPLTTHSYNNKHILKGRSLLEPKKHTKKKFSLASFTSFFFFFDQKKQKTKKVLLTKILSKTRRPKTQKKTSRIIENHGRPISTGRRSDATSSDEFAHGCQQRQRRRPVRAGPDPHRDARVDVDRGTERR